LYVYADGSADDRNAKVFRKYGKLEWSMGTVSAGIS
jgi:hypothetical protein